MTSSYMVTMARPISHPKTTCTWNWGREVLMRLHTQLQSTLKGAFMLIFSINYSKCHHGQLAAANWIWQVNLRVLFTECTRELGVAKGLPKTENRKLQVKKMYSNGFSIGQLENIYLLKKTMTRKYIRRIPFHYYYVL